jgi:hypothetical protein
MITNQEKMETGSVMSTGSERATFITGTKNKNGDSKKKKKEERPDSPMTRAAKALERMNGAPDASLASLAVIPKKQPMDSSDDSDDSESRDKVRALGAPDMPNQLAISMIGANDPYQNYNIAD